MSNRKTLRSFHMKALHRAQDRFNVILDTNVNLHNQQIIDQIISLKVNLLAKHYKGVN